MFEGQVTQLNPVELELEVTFRVVRAWKGVEGETVRVRTRRDTAACGIPFESGKSYLVYASQTTAQSSAIALEALRCGRTRPAEEADEDFAHLGLGVVPVAPREPAAEGAVTTPAAPSAGPSNPATAPKPPAAGGCASCSTTPSGDLSSAALLVACGALAFALRRRR